MTVMDFLWLLVLKLNNNIYIWFVLLNIKFEFIGLRGTSKALIIDVSKVVSQVFMAF